MKQFSYTVDKSSGKPVYHFTWINAPMSVGVYNDIIALVKKSSDYAPVDKKRMAAFATALDGINKKHAVATDQPTTLDQMLSLRNIVLKDKIIKNHSRMNQLIGKISKLYTNQSIQLFYYYFI